MARGEEPILGIAADDLPCSVALSQVEHKLRRIASYRTASKKSVAGSRDPACPSTTTQQSVLLLCLPTFRDATRSWDAKLYSGGG